MADHAKPSDTSKHAASSLGESDAACRAAGDASEASESAPSPASAFAPSRERSAGALDVKVRFGLRVKELRAERGVSQDHVAFSIDMSRSYFSQMELGRRNISLMSMSRIAAGLGVSLRDFFDSDLFA